MKCIKTGAIVALPEYGTRVVADLHAVGNCVVIVFNPDRMYGCKSEPTHEALIGLGYFRKRDGIIVTEREYLTELRVPA